MITINTNYAFILTILAGSATMLGIIPILFNFKDKDKVIISSLGFASGVMIATSFFDLIPESYNYLISTYNAIPSILFIVIFFVIGILLSSYINKNINTINNNLYKVGITSMLAIIIHNLPEGIITFLTASVNKSLGFSLFIAITLHNIPEGISIAVPIYYSTKSKIKAFLYVLIAALSEPLGAIIAYLFLKNLIDNFLLGILLSLIAGIMSNISLYELLPESFSYNRKKLSIISTIIGLIFMYISINFF